MPRIVGLLLLSGALSFACTAGFGKEFKGTPESLLGSYGISEQQCRDHVESYGIDAPYYRTCPNPGCHKRILSHSPTRNGFILNVRDDGNFRTWSERITVTGKNTIKWSAVKSAPLFRCTAPFPLKPQPRTAKVPAWVFSLDFFDNLFFYTHIERRPEQRRYYRIYSGQQTSSQ